MRKSTFTLLIVSIFFLGFTVTVRAAQQPNQWLEQFNTANEAYAAGDYDLALESYEALLDQGLESGAFYYNVGNCYYKKQDFARAILNYERARRLMPDDPDLRANYALAKSICGLESNRAGAGVFLRVFNWLFEAVTLKGLACMISLVNIAIFGMLIAGMFSPGVRRWSGPVLVVLVIGALTIGVESWRRLYEYPRDAVVLRATQSRFEPQEDSTSYFPLNAGESIKVLKRSHGWLKVRRFDAKTGWVKGLDCERISRPLSVDQ